jgi:chromosomal replication initiation ATPase DnaA
MPEQLAFPLPSRRALGREDFFVSPANAAVLAMVEAVDGWPGGRLVIVGPAGAGKTHLAQVFAAATGARVVRPADLAPETLAALAQGPLVLDDAEAAGETALFHLYNLMAEARQPFLMTAARAPAQWGLALADLESRLSSVTVARLGQPDDALFTAVLAKHFADRQISPPANLIPYLVRHMERSLDAAGRVVAEIDRRALAEGRPIGRALAAHILDKDGGNGS